mgnify:CR=1 FL=1
MKALESGVDTDTYFALKAGPLSGLEKDAIVAASKNDKKMDSGIIKFILIHSIGDAYVDRTVTEDEMKQALDQVLV